VDRYHGTPTHDTCTARACAFCRQADPEFSARPPLDQLVTRADTANGHITEEGYIRHRLLRAGYIWQSTSEMDNTGDPGLRAEIAAVVEHILSSRRGDRHVSIVGTQASDQRAMKIWDASLFRGCAL